MFSDPPIVARSQAGGPAKRVRELTLVGKTEIGGQLRERQIRLAEERAGAGDTELAYERSNREAAARTKCSRDMHGMNSSLCSQIIQAERFRKASA